MSAARVEFTRGGHPESRHHAAWCLADADGKVLDGDGATPIFWRSAAKPFQALPAVRAGVLERLGLGDAHLALACASHGGSERHVEIVREVLAAAGLREADLGLGELEPRDPAATAALRAAGRLPSRLTHNCSGKHALALALCVDAGWPLEGYLAWRHPLQEAMRSAIAEAATAQPDDLRHGTDGCGMTTFHLTLGALATAFARLAGGALGAEGARVAATMRAHPDLVAYPGAVDTELMRAEDGLVAKVGAEGVLGVGTADGRGLAVKVLDGAMRALDPAGVALCREVVGLPARSPALERVARPPVRNTRGEVVGEGAAILVRSAP